MKKSAALLFTALCLFLLVGCGKKQDVQVSTTVTQDAKYNAAVLPLSQEEFEKAGFRLGDSCEVVFENGCTLTDVPYYNGYYAKYAAPVIVSYPGFTNVVVTLDNKGIWDSAGLTENEAVTIRLTESGKYLAIQEVLGQVYSFDYADYAGSEQFCNFRSLSGGGLKKDFLYRGASPVDGSRGRAPYTDELLRAAGIGFVMDLADSAEDMASYFADASFRSPYTKELYENGSVALFAMGPDFQSEDYRQKVAQGMRAMLGSSGPVYIHCMEGKDRTGFVCTLLEALAGASYDEMRNDYMKTYENYYSVSAEKTPEKYDAIVALYFDAFVALLHGTEDIGELKTADYVQDAADYLISGGMSQEETEQLRQFITE